MSIISWSRPLRWRGNEVFERSQIFQHDTDALISRLAHGEKPSINDSHLRRQLHQELENGSGVLLINSKVLHLLQKDLFQTTFEAFCLWLGLPVPINIQGQYLKEVRDIGKRDSIDAPQRGHLTSQELAFHSDRADLTVLGCWSPAARGGLFRIRSSVDVVALAEELNKDWLPLLKAPIPHDLRDEGDEKWASIPLLSESENHFVMRYIRKFNDSVIRHGVKQSVTVNKMLDALDEIINRPGEYAEIDFTKGTIVIVNNHITLHARTQFENDMELERCLLRCWLSSEFTRPLPTDFKPLFHNVEAGKSRGGISTGVTGVL